MGNVLLAGRVGELHEMQRKSRDKLRKERVKKESRQSHGAQG